LPAFWQPFCCREQRQMAIDLFGQPTSAAPAQIELRFSERVVEAFSGAELLMVDMLGMKMDKPSVCGRA